MPRVILSDKKTNREELVQQLSRLTPKRKSIDLDQYSGKINFGIDGLTYQLKIRNGW